MVASVDIVDDKRGLCGNAASLRPSDPWHRKSCLRKIEFDALAAVLKDLHLCLNATIDDLTQAWIQNFTLPVVKVRPDGTYAFHLRATTDRLEEIHFHRYGVDGCAGTQVCRLRIDLQGAGDVGNRTT